MPRNSEPVELSLVLFRETDKAFLVGDSGEREKAVWLAKSLTNMNPGASGTEKEIIEGLATHRTLDIHIFLVPEWLANERGLL